MVAVFAGESLIPSDLVGRWSTRLLTLKTTNIAAYPSHAQPHRAWERFALHGVQIKSLYVWYK